MDDLVELTIGRRMRRRRRLMGLTQEALGRACGVSFQQIHKYESAGCRVPVATLWRLSRALGVDVNYFFEGIEDARSASDPPQLRMVV